MGYVLKAVLSSAQHPEYGQITVPFPIPDEKYDRMIELLEPLEIGDALRQDCRVDELDSFYTVLNRLVGSLVNFDELDYLAKRLDSFDDGEAAQFQGMACKLGVSNIKDFINLTFCCQQATVITDFSDLDAIGRQHYMTMQGGGCRIEELERLDGRKFALDLILNHLEGRITPYGVVYPILSDLYKLIEQEYREYDGNCHQLYTAELLQEILLGLHSMCQGAEAQFFNGHTNVTSSRFIVFGVKGLLQASKNVRGAMLFNILSYLDTMSRWLENHGMPAITRVWYTEKNGQRLTLEQECLRSGTLPSIAYGYKKCSLKHKVAPQEKFCRHYQPCIDAWEKGEKVVKFIGYDAGEERRLLNALPHDLQDKKYQKEYPLMEWGWSRKGCIQAIRDAGLPLPGKSSCFFCPSMKRWEIRTLYHRYPDLLRRALAIEDAAMPNLTSVRGLGRNWAWRDFICADENQLAIPGAFSDEDLPCSCCMKGELPTADL